MPVAEVLRKMGISEQTFYRWKEKYGGLGISELRKLKQLEYGFCVGRPVQWLPVSVVNGSG